MNIKKAIIDNLSEIVEIYNHAIETKISTADLEPLTVEDKLEWFNNHIPNKYPIFVIEHENKIIGWSSISPYRPGRMALRYTIELSYFIHKDYQKKGYGKLLIEFILKECKKMQIKNILAIVLENNIASIKLLEKYNFKKWGFLPEVADFDGNKCGHYYYGLKL